MRLAALDRNFMHITGHDGTAWQLLGSRPFTPAGRVPEHRPGGAWNRQKTSARTWVWGDLDPELEYLIWFNVAAWRWEAQGVMESQPVRTRLARNRRSRWEGDRDQAECTDVAAGRGEDEVRAGGGRS